MFDLLFELLLMLAEVFVEFLLELALAGLLDLALRALVRGFERFRFDNWILALTGYVLLGASTGGLSLLFFPHPLVRPSRLHGISLVVSPIATGLAMSLIGSILGRQGKSVTQIESFGYGFALAFGIALIRYVFAT